MFRNSSEIKDLINRIKSGGNKIVFTNGVFDIIHRGHVEYLSQAKALGDILVVGLNSDSSVKAIKGDKRPIVTEENRAYVLANLKAVDYVVIFDEDNPYNVIKAIMPDILVKGSDWDGDKIIGSDIVKQNGGEVKRIKFVENNSSTNIIEEIIKKYCNPQMD
ncbi:MAG TPA: D-glycero-beta-D-manno-heptose 1-phosphate adenylyltransferase [Ignavibacteria bacterium]